MQSHKRAIAVLAISQIACLACGLWISDRFLLASVQWQLESASTETADPADPADQTDSPARAGEADAQQTAAASGLAAIRGHMPIVRIMTLIWIGGLQVVAAYLVLMRVLSETSQTHAESQLRLLHREKDLVRTRNAVIFGLAKLAEYRDRETGQHLERIALYSTCLATALRRDRRFRDRISPAFVKTIGISSVLHDIGKVGIGDEVLRKEGPLDDGERQRMQRHTRIGAECIRQIEQRLGSCNFLQMAQAIAANHHERWDGGGYPQGLAGEAIPLAARVVAIADVYDALASKRVYKDAYSHERCVEIILETAGSHLDPAMVDVFLRVESQFAEIAGRFSDVEEDGPQAVLAESVSSRSVATRDKLIRSILEQGDHVAEPLAATT